MLTERWLVGRNMNGFEHIQDGILREPFSVLRKCLGHKTVHIDGYFINVQQIVNAPMQIVTLSFVNIHWNLSIDPYHQTIIRTTYVVSVTGKCKLVYYRIVNLNIMGR